MTSVLPPPPSFLPPLTLVSPHPHHSALQLQQAEKGRDNTYSLNTTSLTFLLYHFVLTLAGETVCFQGEENIFRVLNSRPTGPSVKLCIIAVLAEGLGTAFAPCFMVTELHTVPCL